MAEYARSAKWKYIESTQFKFLCTADLIADHLLVHYYITVHMAHPDVLNQPKHQNPLDWPSSINVIDPDRHTSFFNLLNWKVEVKRTRREDEEAAEHLVYKA